MKNPTEHNAISLYIHMPWCIKKCPYCDFNSHTLQGSLPETDYIERVLEDLEQYQDTLQDRSISTIFIGGGTPSLFSGAGLKMLIDHIKKQYPTFAQLEITMEANPGTLEQQRFSDFLNAGVNRLSLGIQSFNDTYLETLGRIHNSQQAINATSQAQQQGFDNINIDLMFGLPGQSEQQALNDLQQAIALKPQHISWYQLTIEPNTYFNKFPPTLPENDAIADMQLAGQNILTKHGFIQYEISAYAQQNKQCQHNVNYWQYGDYLGIGAGAHSKITNNGKIHRHWNVKNPKDYLNKHKPFTQNSKTISSDEIILEYLMNRMRLYSPITAHEFIKATGKSFGDIQARLDNLISNELITQTPTTIALTAKGHLFLNDILQAFI